MPADSIQLIIDYENGNIKQVSAEAERELDNAGKKGGSKFSGGFSIGAGAVLKKIGQIGAAAAALGGIALFKAVKDAASLEVINTQFEVMLKSASAAKKQVADLQDFAASTPFQLPGLAAAATQLLSFGTAQKDIIPTLQQLGDLAAGVGVEIGDLTIPFGRLQSTQKLTLIELDKFADKGINIYKSLSEQTGISLKTIRDDISKGRVPYEEFTTALNGLTGKSGLFFQGMEKKSKTLTGVISTLGDNFFNLSASIGKTFSPIIVEGALKIIEVLKDLNKEVTENFNIFDDVIEPMLKFNEALITYVVVPFEQLINIGSLVQNHLNFVFAKITSGVANLGLGIAFVLEKLNIGKGLSQGLKDFEETSELVADNVQKQYGEAFDKLGDFPLADKLSTKNEELRAFFNEQRAIVDEEAAITDEKLATQIAVVADQSQTFAKLLVDTFKGVQIGITNTKEQMAKVATQTASIMKNGLAKGISGGIQNIVTSLAQGENVFANFGKFLLGLFGDLAIQLGSFWIAKGIAIEAATAVSGTGAIVAGAALIAVGSLMKSFAGGGGASASAGGGGGSASTPTFGSPDQPTGEFLEEDSREALVPTTNVTFNIDGNVKGDEEFIRDTVASIGEEAGKQGLVFNNFQTA